MSRVPSWIAAALLLAQLGLIVAARAKPARYFCWAPFDMQTDYQLEVAINGYKLSAAEIQLRYRTPAEGTDNRSVQNLIDVLEGYEEQYAGANKAKIVMHYRINGKEDRLWQYPPKQ